MFGAGHPNWCRPPWELYGQVGPGGARPIREMGNRGRDGSLLVDWIGWFGLDGLDPNGWTCVPRARPGRQGLEIMEERG